MPNEKLVAYRRWLECELGANQSEDKEFVKNSFAETLQASSAYQADSTVNGETQPLVATRKETKKCDVAIIPGTTLCIGDLVNVFNENWICVEVYADEFGMAYGELWMCNQIFNFQNHNSTIITRCAILDDGSYSNGSDKAIKVTENSFNCYMSLDDDTKKLFVDKRLAVGEIYNDKGEVIIEVGQIKWLDNKSKNFGEGSHLLVFGIVDAPYNPQVDDVERMICDYIPSEDVDNEEDIPEENLSETPGYITISGRTTLRVGTGRDYSASVINKESGATIENVSLTWSIAEPVAWISLLPSGNSCRVTLKEDNNLSGETFTLLCESEDGNYESAQFEVEVV